MTTAASVEWTVVRNEVEALVLEHTWIKQYDPRFNVVFKDDKSYPFLAVTMNEKYPRMQVMRGDRKKGVRYFGPYAKAWAIRETVDTLLTVLAGAHVRAGGVPQGRAPGQALPAGLHRQVRGAVRGQRQRGGAPRACGHGCARCSRATRSR